MNRAICWLTLLLVLGLGCPAKGPTELLPEEPSPGDLVPVDPPKTPDLPPVTPLPPPKPEPKTLTVPWREIPPPILASGKRPYFYELAFIGDKVFAEVGEKDLYLTQDYGQTWTVVDTKLDISHVSGYSSPNRIFDIDADGTNLYIATGAGLIVSTDSGETFSWSFHWTWDEFVSVDFEGGYGIGRITSFGSMSGNWYRTPTTDWKRSGWYGTFDLLDPAHVSYASSSVRTVNDAGEESWFNTSRTIEVVGKFGDKPYLGSKGEYSLDRGRTWQSLGFEYPDYYPAVAIPDPDGVWLFDVVVKRNSGSLAGPVVAGKPGGPWYIVGWDGQYVYELAVHRGELWAWGEKLFVLRLADISSNP